MVNPFKKETPPYRADIPETPYQRAQQEWDERIGSARVQAKNWRLAAFAAMLVALFALIALAVVLATRTEKIFIAEVTQGGKIVNIAPLRTTYNPSVAQKEYFIGQFIEMLRSIPLDPVVAKKNWINAYAFLTQRAATKLNAQLQRDNPIAILGKKTVTVKVGSVNALSDNSFVVDWSERVVGIDGGGAEEKSYSGVFTIAIKAPTTQRDILQNPLGIYIVDFNLSEKT